jgi:N-acetylmuramoyl-L-alanine amidase
MSSEKPAEKSPLLICRRRFLGLGLGMAANALFFSSAEAAQGIMQGGAAEMMLAARNPAPSRKPKPPRIIMIDPGHGGKDPGAIGRSGTFEKDVTLDISRQMAEHLSLHPGIIARLTRDTDIFLPLKQRVEIAREAKADLFISVHADSAPTTAARGFSAYSLSDKATDNFARELAKRENSVDEIAGIDLKETEPDVAAILRDLTVRYTRNAALKAKKHIVRGMKGKWELLDNPMRAADFAVLRAPDIPSLLLETGFLSNPKDEALLRSEAQRQRIARLLAGQFSGLLTTPPFA